MSLYRDEAAGETDYQKCVELLSAAFPLEDKQKSAGFYTLLVRCMMDEGFTAKRVYDATMFIIKNFKYKKFNIADVVQYDRKVPLYTYNEVCKMVTSGSVRFENEGGDLARYGKIDGVEFWYRKSELIKARLNN